jgi:drug/metabolite transporter (DMT)-like permease
MPYLRLIGAQAAIGAAAIFARFALTGTGPLSASALRLAIAAVPLLALALLGRPRSLGWRREAAFAAAGVALAVHFAAWIGSLLYTTVAISTLLVCTSPIWTGLYDAATARATPRGLGWAFLLAAAGLALVTSQRGGGAAQVSNAPAGAALALLGSLGIGIYLLIVRSAGAHPASGPPVATRQIVARTYTWAALTLLPLAALAGQRPPAAAAWVAWSGILAMALVSQLLGHTALNAALRHFTPSTVALSTVLEPVVAAVLAAAIFHETFTPLAAAGGICILAGIVVALRADPAAVAQ